MVRHYIFFVFVLTAIFQGHPALAKPSPIGFEQAYDREIQLLESERTIFDSKIETLKNKLKQKTDTFRQEAVVLAEELTTLRLQNDSLEERVQRGQLLLPEAESMEGTVLESLWQQAGTTFNDLGIEQPEPTDTPEDDIVGMFSRALSQIKRIGDIRVARGNWFDKAGKRQEGKILYISGVSAIGLDKEFGGKLQPTPSGDFQVVAPIDEQVMDYLNGSKAYLKEAILETFLFDPLLDEQNNTAQDKTLWNIFLSGGFVMWPILALALLCILIVTERLFTLRRIHTNAERLMKKVGLHILNNTWDAAKAVCDKNRGAVAQVMRVILTNRHRSRQQQEELVYEVILSQKPKMERFLSVLNIVAAVAPLLGLLGTVTGMIGTFDIITVHGTGDPKMLSGGISEALITTQFGLIVAIPALFAHAILSSRVDHVTGDMESNAMRLLNQLHVPEDKHSNRTEFADAEAMKV